MVYGYTQSDEISLLFHRDEQQFHRKLRKLHSVLAGADAQSPNDTSWFALALECDQCRFSTVAYDDETA
jgi:tRNA(His) 5'-end guanylyltransferase